MANRQVPQMQFRVNPPKEQECEQVTSPLSDSDNSVEDKPAPGAKFFRTVYDSIPVPLGIFTLGVAPLMVDACDSYVMDRALRGIVAKARRDWFPYFEKLDNDWNSDGGKNGKHSSRRSKQKGSSKKRQTSAEQHTTEAQCTQQLVLHSRRGSGDEPDGEPDCLSLVGMQCTPRGEMLRPINYMEMIKAHSTSSSHAGGSGAGVSGSTILLDPAFLMQQRKDMIKRQLLGMDDYAPVFARDDKAWEFPMSKGEVNDRLSAKLHLENSDLKEKVDNVKERANMVDWRSFVNPSVGQPARPRAIDY